MSMSTESSGYGSQGGGEAGVRPAPDRQGVEVNYCYSCYNRAPLAALVASSTH